MGSCGFAPDQFHLQITDLALQIFLPGRKVLSLADQQHVAIFHQHDQLKFSLGQLVTVEALECACDDLVDQPGLVHVVVRLGGLADGLIGQRQGVTQALVAQGADRECREPETRKPALGGLLECFMSIERCHETGTWWYTVI